MKQNKWLMAANIACLLIFFFILLQILANGFLAKLDIVVYNALFGMKNSFLTIISKILGIGLDTLVAVLLSLIIAVIIWFKGSKKDAKFFAAVMLADAGIVFVIKEIIRRARPLNALTATDGFSFPSGHATVAAVLFGILLYFALKRSKSGEVKLIAIAAAIIIPPLTAFTRIYLGVHWLTDVLGGLALGAIIVTGAILLREHFDNRDLKKEKKSQSTKAGV